MCVAVQGQCFYYQFTRKTAVKTSLMINSRYEDVFAKMFESLKWERIAAITEDGQKYTEYITHMGMEPNSNKYKIIVNSKLPRESKQLEHFEKVNIISDVLTTQAH